MKTIAYICFSCLISLSAFCQQFYIRGEVKDEAGNVLQNVAILQQSTGLVFRSGSYGTFGILTNQRPDTFLFSMNGFRSEKIFIRSDEYQQITLKTSPVTNNQTRKEKLSSFTKDLSKDIQKQWFAGDETYTSLLENHFVKTDKFPVTGMSLNIDRASYSNIRRFIAQKSFVPPDAVRIEEMLNYFNLFYHQPEERDIFHIKTTLTHCPWNQDNQLFFINLSAQKINTEALPPSHLVFLVDVSGSMDMPNRLPLLKNSFRLLVNNLREKDTVSIVVYGGVTGIMLQPAGGNEKEKIYQAINELTPGGSTPGESGIRTAYGLAKHHFIKGGNNRVILATDGDFNVGVKTEEELDQLISHHRESGIYLTCLGVGMGNYKDSRLQTLARKGNGNFAYIDNFKESEKVLLKEFTQTMYTIADEVFMNVRFNPDYVKEYRLIGFDNRAGSITDSFARMEGGEIGSGYALTAMFELEPTENNRTAIKKDLTSGNLSAITVDYSLPDHDTSRMQFNYNSRFKFTAYEELDRCQRFSTAVVLFGAILRSSPFVKNSGWNDILSIANASADMTDNSQKEFIGIVEQAKTIYTKGKKKKGKNDLTYR